MPVILSDQVELPFQDVIDYRQVSIKWPSTRIGPELLDYLESLPGALQFFLLLHIRLYFRSLQIILNVHTIMSDEVIEGIIARGRRIRCLWVYASEDEPCSATSGILWELQRKVRQFHQSAETFWLHNGSIVNRDLIEFDNWRTPVPLP